MLAIIPYFNDSNKSLQCAMIYNSVHNKNLINSTYAIRAF